MNANIKIKGYEDADWSILGTLTVLGKTFHSIDIEGEDIIPIVDENFNVILDDSPIDLVSDLYVYFEDIGDAEMAEALLPYID